MCVSVCVCACGMRACASGMHASVHACVCGMDVCACVALINNKLWFLILLK